MKPAKVQSKVVKTAIVTAPVNASAPAETKPEAKASKPKAPKFAADRLVSFNSNGRFPGTEYSKALNALPIDPEAMTHTGYLVTEGARGVLVNPIAHDGKGHYSRPETTNGVERTVFGSSSLLIESVKGLKVSIVTAEELVKRALALNQCFTYKHSATGTEITVMLVNPSTQSYFAGIDIVAGKLRVTNMESVEKYNTEKVRYTQLKAVTDGKLAAALLNYSGGTKSKVAKR